MRGNRTTSLYRTSYYLKLGGVEMKFMEYTCDKNIKDDVVYYLLGEGTLQFSSILFSIHFIYSLYSSQLFR